MSGPKLGIALGAGGAKGWCHVGVLQALKAADIEPDVVVGTSMGALVGAVHIAGRLDDLAEWAKSASWSRIAGLIDVNFRRGGLTDGRRVRRFLKTLDLDAPIESYRTPYAAVATDLVSGREIWLTSGPIDAAIRASIASPGIFSPQQVDGRWLMDGGLTNPVPVSVCRALGAEVIVAVSPNSAAFTPEPTREAASRGWKMHVLPQNETLDRLIARVPANMRQGLRKVGPDILGTRERAPGYFDVLTTAINIMTDQIRRSRLAGDPPHVLIGPHLSDISVLEFNRASEAIEEGRIRTEEALPAIKRFLGRG